MVVANESVLESVLAEQDQTAWDQLVERLLPSVHPIDQAATRIWFAFWPLKLNRLLRECEDLAELVRDRRLVGRFRLEEQVESSVEFFYGSHYWPAVKRAVLSQAETSQSNRQFDFHKTALETAAQAGRNAGVDASLVLGVSLAGLMILRQTGHSVFSAAPEKARSGTKIPSPERVLRDRLPRKPGLLSFLKSADKNYRVRFDERNPEATYSALHGQDLSMASAGDKRDYSTLDPRRLEGPVPFECRSGTCGYCWVGVLAGADRLEPISEYEARRLRYFGYISHSAKLEPHPPIRLACQTQCKGDVTIVVSPWNGILRRRT